MIGELITKQNVSFLDVKSNVYTTMQVIDVSNPLKPQKLSEFSQKGDYKSSTMVNGYLYLSSFNSIYNKDPIDNAEDYAKYIPSYYCNEKENFIDPEDILLPEDPEVANYTVLSGLDINKKDLLVSTKAFFSYSGINYNSLNNFYLVNNTIHKNKLYATIAKLNIDKGNISTDIINTVEGCIINSSFLNEQNNNLRVVTSAKMNDKDDFNSNKNNVYILNEKLDVISKIKNIAEDSTLESVHFDKNLLQISTDNNENAILNFDLSDSNITKKDEISCDKISAYLTSYNKNKLIGINTKGNISVNLFDITSKSNFNKLDSVNIDKDLKDAKTEIYQNSKAFFVDNEKSIIGIPVSLFNGINFSDKFYFYNVNDDKIKELGKIEIYNRKFDCFKRNILINDYVYIFSNEKIISTKKDKIDVVSSVDLLN